MSRTIVALGPGDVASVPAAALDALRALDPEVVHAAGVDPDVARLIDRPFHVIGDPGGDLPDGVLAAPDPIAHAWAARTPQATTVPDRPALRERAIGAAVARLAGVGAHLRRECPWDRVQTAETIVPHTVEEAFEVAEAVASGDVARQADEVGDLLFQSVFLAQLLEEGEGIGLDRIADDHADKLIARHPHVYGDAVAREAGGVRDLWERQKRESRGGAIFHEMPEGLPALAYATKAQKRAASVGFAFADLDGALAKLREEVAELGAAPAADELGDVLFAAVAVARALPADPEIAVRLAARRFRTRVERAAELADAAGETFDGATPERQLHWYAIAKDDPAAEAPSS